MIDNNNISTTDIGKQQIKQRNNKIIYLFVFSIIILSSVVFGMLMSIIEYKHSYLILL